MQRWVNAEVIRFDLPNHDVQNSKETETRKDGKV